jgi:addiction module HigA family antidote
LSEESGDGYENPSHPGALVRDNLDELGVSVAEAAGGLGITRQQLYNIVNCRSAITSEMALRLEKALGGSAELWLRMQVNYDLAQARKRVADLNVTRLQPKVA